MMTLDGEVKEEVIDEVVADPAVPAEEVAA